MHSSRTCRGRNADALVVDLRSRLSEASVTFSTPATPVHSPRRQQNAIAGAVGAALDNVTLHCGSDAPAWVLVESEPTVVTITIRDDGPGMAEGRLAAAEREGRLGIAQSIIGRIRDVGGTATVTSHPGAGTEIELKLPLP